MNVTEYIAYSIIGIYALTILSYTIGWLKIKTFIAQIDISKNHLSIVVACRNEEQNIPNLLEALLNQTYPKEKIEIIIIDDHSEDNTIKIIDKYSEDFDFIKLLRLPESKSGKKEAIAFGVKNSSSEIIITTDADCTMNKYWLRTLVNYYDQFKPKLLVGPVAFKNRKTLLIQLQCLEFLSLVGSGAGAIGINHAIMSNGANLLFEKSAFLESKLYYNYASGDDVFFMLHIKKKYKKAIKFIKSKNAIVYTKAEKSIRGLFNQRLRWTSKSKMYRDFDIIFTAIIVTLTNLVLVFSFAYSIFNFSFFSTFITIFILKSIFDLSILIPVSRFFHQQKLLWLFLPLQFKYPFYIILTVSFGLIGNFNWKGRNFKEKR
ncbi:MAG: glycosyltransferase [Bacteroidales bacterium]|jgi:cellulose synthase/poly-beta-1,6-N-acetylglucosamine synthase-like glycosyltransferase|nr:glycosyltransferase [Bacteroidales bacterium]